METGEQWPRNPTRRDVFSVVLDVGLVCLGCPL
jgi:hypothetical protein